MGNRVARWAAVPACLPLGRWELWSINIHVYLQQMLAVHIFVDVWWMGCNLWRGESVDWDVDVSYLMEVHDVSLMTATGPFLSDFVNWLSCTLTKALVSPSVWCDCSHGHLVHSKNILSRKATASLIGVVLGVARSLSAHTPTCS